MITIRPYTEDDWDAICRIHDRARPHELAGSCDPRAFVPLAQDPESREIPEYRMVVACVGEQVIGFAGVRDTYIGWLYVDPEFYRQGVGRVLLQRAKDMAGSGAWTIALRGNARAVHLYQSEGFGIVEAFASDNAGYPCTCLRLSLLARESTE